MFQVQRYLLLVALISGFLFGVAPTASATGNLVGYWKFDETSGNALDSSGNNITLTNNGSVTYSTGTQGNAAVFNGSNFLSSSNGPNLANSSFTFSFWIKTTNIDSDRDFFGLGNVEDTNQALHLRVTPGGTSMRLGFYANDLDISANITTNEWHNILFIYDKDGTLGHGTGYRTAYVDGDQKDEQTGVSAFVGNRNLTIGKSPFFSWVGQVDDFRIYNRGLTSAEIDTIASGGSGPGVGLELESFLPSDNATNVNTSVTPSLTFGTTTAATSTGTIGLYKTSDNSLVESFAINSSRITKSTTVASTTFTISPTSALADSTEYYFWIASTTFADGLSQKWEGTTASTTWSFTTGDFSTPDISGVTASTTSSSAGVGWTTSETASTRVAYGLTSSYSTYSSETDTSPRATSHYKAISGLLGCTTYHYAAVSRDAAGNTATSTDGTFTTAGCTSDVVPSSATSTAIADTGGSTNLTTDGKTFTVSVPADATSTSFVIQIKALANTSILASLGSPGAKPEEVGTTVFDVKAIVNETIFDSFDAAVTISYTYTDSEISGLDESSLQLYHYHNSAWEALSGCTVNTSTNTISCTTDSFSIFGLFGSQTTSSSHGSVTTLQQRIKNLNDSGNAARAQELAKQYPQISTQTQSTGSSCPRYTFTRSLKKGMLGEDVRALQKFLNCQGFTLSLSGPGAPGEETNLFADRTFNAVVRFQEAYADEVLKPGNLTRGTGFFGTYSQKKAHQLLGTQQ